MKEILERYISQFHRDHQKRRKAIALFVVLSLLVSGSVTWRLKSNGIAMTNDAFCGKEEHQHSDACYTEVLTCGLEETEGHHHSKEAGCYEEQQTLVCTENEHTHGDECYDEEGNLICTEPEHTHGEECYQTEEVLVCEKPETEGHTHDESCYTKELTCEKEEHTHTAACYSNSQADLETAADWEKTIPAGLGENWAENVVKVAASQLGYAESTKNYQLSESDGTSHKGYTRYGAWYGNDYGDWSAMFVSFCLKYAGVPENTVPYASGAYAWSAALSEKGLYQDKTYAAKAGDIIFLDKDQDGKAERVGIVESVSEDGKQIKTIEGDCQKDGEDVVAEVTYAADDAKIVGYGEMAVNPEAEAENDETDDEADAEADKTEETQDVSTEAESEAEADVEADAEETAETEDVPQEQNVKDGAAVQAENAVSFAEWINSVDLKYRENEWASWKDLQKSEDGTYHLKQNDQLQFNLNYTVPANTLKKGETETIMYQIPEGLKLTQELSGTVEDETGVKVGTYEITKDGKIKISFYDEYLENNEKGQAINGNIKFEASASDLSTDEKGEGQLPINSKVTVGIYVTDKVYTTEDLQVTKTAGTPDQTDGTVSYEIEISSANGTGSEVTLTDEMSQLLLAGDFSVTDENGNPVSVTTPAEGSKDFTLKLPQMSAGGKYKITYKSQVSKEFNGTLNTNNKATAESTKENGAKLKDTVSVDTDFKRDMISKTGAEQSDGSILWTVTVNSEGRDISGWTLEDVLNGTSYTGDVNVSPAIGGNTKISLPYQFPKNTKETYTISYTTDADVPLGDDSVRNKAVLTPKDKEDQKMDSGEFGIKPGDGKKNNPLSKKAGKFTVNEDGKTADAEWTVTIDTEKGALPAGWIYTDTAQGEQWFTAKQLRDIKTELDKLNVTYTLKAVDQNWQTVEESGITEGQKYRSYNITFADELPKGSNLTFSYKTTISIENANGNKDFYNDANINGKVTAQDKITYKEKNPTITKTGQNGTLDYKNLEDGNLKWNIKVVLPEGYDGEDLVMKEHLPAGLTLTSLTMTANDRFWNADITADKTYELNGYSITKSTDAETGILSVTIPQTLAKENGTQEINFEIKLKIPENYTWTGTGNIKTADFQNAVSLEDMSGKDYGESSHTQTVNKDESIQVTKKKAEKTEGSNVIRYSVEVNPDGLELIPGAEKLVMTDVLTYDHNPYYLYQASLVPGSVKVYPAKKSGDVLVKDGDQPLAADEWSYIYKEWIDSSAQKANNSLTFEIPNKRPLLIEYQYKITASANMWTGMLVNTAEITGLSGQYVGSQESTNIQVVDSSAGAKLGGVTIYKVDTENTNETLNDAEFNLYKWDSSQKDYTLVVDKNGNSTLVTSGSGNNKGKLSLSELAYNTAYKLVEIKAPTGYKLSDQPLYFYVFNADKTTYPQYLPENFNGSQLTEGAVIYYDNTKEDSPQYELPETGGPGTNGYTAGGLAIMLAAGLVYRKKKKAKKGDRGLNH